MALPKIVAFDLDETLWEPEILHHAYLLNGGAPFCAGCCARGRPVAVDRRGEEVGLIGDAWRILHELATDEKWAGTQIAYVSRTDEPQWAAECLRLLKLDNGLSLHDLAHHHEIYPGPSSKRTHFRRIHERTGIAYADMLFFDDMQMNTEDCARLGVVSIYAPRGLTADAWHKGLAEFARRRG